MLSRVTEQLAENPQHVQQVPNAIYWVVVLISQAAVRVQLAQSAPQVDIVKIAVKLGKWQIVTTPSAKPACQVALLSMIGRLVRHAQEQRTRVSELSAQRVRIQM